MHNFIYYNPTEIIFGKGKISSVGNKVLEWTNTKNILLVISKSCKTNGILDTIKKSLNENKINYYIVDGIVSNPTLECVIKGKKIYEENKLDFILAVGGASVIDTAKTIAVAVNNNDNDIWDLICNPSKIKSAAPLGVIITIYGSGTEMTNGAVITNLDIPKKRGYDSKYLFPKFSILDPNTLNSINRKYSLIGMTDMFCHVLETYFEITDDENISDDYLELLSRQMIEEFLKFKNNKQDNSVLLWLSTLAQNNFLTFGKEYKGEWVAHIIAHEFCLKYNFPHGEVVSVLLISWLKYIKKIAENRLIKFGEKVFNLNTKNADDTITKISEIFNILENPHNLKNMNVNFEDLKSIINNATTGKKLGHYKELSINDVENIVLGAYYGN